MYETYVTFAHHLERMLGRAYPDRLVEVINLGIAALAARQVKVLVEDVCRIFSPDVVLIYSGNNEFLEIHAEKYAASNANPITRMSDLMAQTHIYRLVDQLFAAHRKRRHWPSRTYPARISA